MFRTIGNFIEIFRALFRARRYSTQGNTIEVLRFSDMKPSKVTSRRIELFYKPRLVRSTVFVTALSLVLLWTLRSYVEIFKSL